jgi:hypothetical protein
MGLVCHNCSAAQSDGGFLCYHISIVIKALSLYNIFIIKITYRYVVEIKTPAQSLPSASLRASLLRRHLFFLLVLSFSALLLSSPMVDPI